MEATPERKPPNRGIEVKLLGHSPDPIRSLYLAYRTAYSALTPLQINDRIEDERITRETMLGFIEKRLETGHASPLEQLPQLRPSSSAPSFLHRPASSWASRLLLQPRPRLLQPLQHPQAASLYWSAQQQAQASRLSEQLRP